MSRVARHTFVLLALSGLGGAMGWWMRSAPLQGTQMSATAGELSASERAQRLADYQQRLEAQFPLKTPAPGAVREALRDPAAAARAARDSGDPQAVMNLARAFALEPPPALAAFLEHAADTPEARALLQGEAIKWAFSRDAARGLAQLAAVDDVKAQAAFAEKTLRFFPPKDLPIVRAWYDRLPAEPLKDAATTRLLPVLARQDFPEALALAAALPELGIDEITFRRKQLTSLVLEHSSATTPEDREALLVGLPPSDADAARAKIREDYFNALQIYHDKAAAADYLTKLPEERRGEKTQELFAYWARTDPGRAVQGLEKLPDELKTPEVITGFAQSLTQANVTRASAWVSQLPAGSQKDAAIGGLVQGLRETYPAEALTWAAAVTDPDQRRASLREAMLFLPSEPSEARRARFDALPLSEEDKTAVLTPPAPSE